MYSIRIKTLAVLLVISVIMIASGSLCRLAAQDELQALEKTETAGWLKSGKIRELYPVWGSGERPSRVFIEKYASSLRVEALVSYRDTLWIGTEGGLYAYSTVHDSLSGVEGPFFVAVKALAVDDEGSLWVGGDEGISVRRGSAWFHYSSDNISFLKRVTGIVNGDGRVWVTTFGKGCGYVISDSLTVLSRADSLLDDRVNCIIEERDGIIWFGTASGLCRADSFSWQSLRYGSRIPTGSINDMSLDEEGNIFLAVEGAGVARLNLGRVTRYGAKDGLPEGEINAFSLDPAGRVWAAGRSGVSVYDGSGWMPMSFPGMQLSEYGFLSICHDVEGTAYTGTDRGSFIISNIDYAREVAIPQRFPISMVSVIAEYDGVIWMMSGSRIFRFRQKIEEIRLPDPWFEGALTGMTIDRSGILWVSTRFGILQFNNGAWQIFDKRLGLPTDHFRWVSRGDGDDLWFGTFNKGIMRLTSKGWTHYTDQNGLPSNIITGLVTDSDRLPWILSESGKIARFVSDKWESFDMSPRGKAWSTPVDPEPELDAAIRFIGGKKDSGVEVSALNGFALGTDSAGRVLFCRSDGIFRYSENSWQVIDIPDAARRYSVSSITGMANGELYLGTKGSGLLIRRSGGWIGLGVDDGLSDEDILTICRDRSGRLWAGTRSGGISIINTGK
ncbi:MAG: hypothetical protein JW814_01985 [Candidatus Krumholzibacteriota bacterium]|nr:hypothetical protein [Candidatus Krumholzibacteriota bacterium]